MSVNVDQLDRELRFLRRDEGRTLVKLLASPQLRTALRNPSDAQLVAVFDAAIAGLGNDRKALALRNAYAIGLRTPGTLTKRREDFGGQAAVNRSPDTVKAWEGEQIQELVARLVAGEAMPGAQHLLVAVAVSGGRIVVVTEGEAESGKPMRQWANPNPGPFWPGFIYATPDYLQPSRLTITVLFMDHKPVRVLSEAAGDLLAFVCGDGHQELNLIEGGIPGVEAAASVAVHWDQPIAGVYYGIAWAWQSCQSTAIADAPAQHSE